MIREVFYSCGFHELWFITITTDIDISIELDYYYVNYRESN